MIPKLLSPHITLTVLAENHDCLSCANDKFEAAHYNLIGPKLATPLNCSYIMKIVLWTFLFLFTSVRIPMLAVNHHSHPDLHLSGWTAMRCCRDTHSSWLVNAKDFSNYVASLLAPQYIWFQVMLQPLTIVILAFS